MFSSQDGKWSVQCRLSEHGPMLCQLPSVRMHCGGDWAGGLVDMLLELSCSKER